MKISNFVVRMCAALVIAGSFAALVQAQNRERFGISATAGGVNAVLGEVMVKRQGQAPQLLTSQDNLNSGDTVNTGFGSQAEILLNPGTYLRLAEKSELVLVDNSLDKLLVKLNKGSAIIEATGPDQVELRIPIMTEQQRMTIVRAGIYRINVTSHTTELLIRQGRMLLDDDSKTIIKRGKKLTFTSGAAPMIAKLNKSDQDEFDNWSKERGENLARANQRLPAQTLNAFLSTSDVGWPFANAGWGIWTWSPFARCYTFLPFRYGWGSPYGRYYGFYAGFGGLYEDGTCCRLRIYNEPLIVSYPTVHGSNGGYTGSSGGPGSTATSGVQPVGGSPQPQPQPVPMLQPRPESRPGGDSDFGGRPIRIKDPD
jgi:hypothetical protein